MAQLAASPASRRRAGFAPAHARKANLTLVSRPHIQRSSIPFTVLCTLVLLGAVIATLLLNISMTNMSYEVAKLQRESRELSEQTQMLEEKSDLLGTPQELERQARELGMVPAGKVAYIDLANGSMIGEPAAATQGAAALVPHVAKAPKNLYDYGMGNERAR
ncbi:septum formation initiator family protein [Dermabacter hominis]|uniref:septum formation initiator family protein n=1 Tax=Dermabacter hominis TaxID=36740 RepID=UPI00242C8C7D|nr:septum formation initiator family protein [Dermabacter hominis]